MKSYTDIEQSKELTKILPIESADMCFVNDGTSIKIDANPYNVRKLMWKDYVVEVIPCWSFATLLNYIKDKCSYFELVYLRSTFDSRENKLENVYRLSTNVYDVYEKEVIDACYKMILDLHEQKIL